MLQAELHGKLGEDGRRAHERMEDILTSNVFGLLRYLPADEGLLAWLRCAEPFRNGEPVRSTAKPEVHFWPRLGRGEVDVLLVLPVGSDAIDLVAVECKYLSGKSGSAREVDAEQKVERDQLAKYARALAEDDFDIKFGDRGPRRRVVMYVTADAAMPREDLRESVEALGYERWADSFYWLRWDQLWNVLDSIALGTGAHSTVAQDLRALLARKRLRPFLGFAGLATTRAAFGAPAWRVRWGDLASRSALSGRAQWRIRWSTLERGNRVAFSEPASWRRP